MLKIFVEQEGGIICRNIIKVLQILDDDFEFTSSSEEAIIVISDSEKILKLEGKKQIVLISEKKFNDLTPECLVFEDIYSKVGVIMDTLVKL